MIIIKIAGGLGNQMFEYASAWALSKRLQQPLVLFVNEKEKDRPFRLKQLKLSVKSILRPEQMSFALKVLINKQVKSLFKRLHKSNYRFEDWLYFRQLNDKFQEDFFTVDAPNIFLDGYFQCESYFRDCRTELVEQFKPSYEIEPVCKQVLEQIKSCNSVAVHVRRGDFQQSSHRFHYLLTGDYYRRAIAYMKERLEDPQFFWFSEDFDWIQENFGNKKEFHFVKTKTANSDIDDIMLMKNCNHIITANSSFSWWGAWLNEYDDAIRIVPDKEFMPEGSIPETWVKLPV